MNNEGFIKLHRKMLEWAWADDPTVFYFFVKLIFAVNYKDKLWHGITIKRGQIVTSINGLCEITSLSRNAVLRCLKNLAQTGEISEEVKPNKYRIITVTNYNTYQDSVDPLKDNYRDNSRDNYRDNYRGTTKERKKVSFSPKGKKIRGRVEKKKNKLTEKKMKWTFGDVKEFAKTVPGGDDYNACDFRRGFVKSGTAFPDNWQDVFRSFASAGLEAQEEFLKKLESGDYISKWGMGEW